MKCANVQQDQGNIAYVNGQVEWREPYGELPGTIIALLPLYWIVSFFYLMLGIFWGILSFRFKLNLTIVQKIIGVVCFLGFVECLITASDYQNYNHTGKISLAFNVFTVLFLVTTRGISFIGLQLVVLGYSVYRKSLPPNTKKKLISLSVCYFVFTYIYQFLNMFRQTPETYYINISDGVVYLFLIPSVVTDIIFFFWIFWALYRSLSNLSVKKQPVKLLMFQRLRTLLLIAYIVSIIFFIIQIGASLSTTAQDNWWKGWWIFDIYWPLLHLVVLSGVILLWMPSSHNSRYAYSEQFDESEVSQSEVELPRINSGQKEEYNTL